jgi:hypothetical protein
MSELIKLKNGNTVTKDEIISRAYRQQYGISQALTVLFIQGNKKYMQGDISGNFYVTEVNQ